MTIPALPFDVVVLGEILLEISTQSPLADGVDARLGVSGDALNVAASAAAAGARVGLLSIIGDDEIGRMIASRVSELGISTDLLRLASGRQGIYFVHSDPSGEREFSYARSESVGSTLAPHDVDSTVFSAAGAVVASGITCAISASAREAVVRAAGLSGRFIFDPNFRPKLTTADEALRTMTELAPRSALMTPSHPVETRLLGVDSPEEAGRRLRALGAEAVAVTCGTRGVVLVEDEPEWVDAVPATSVVDQTGAGDSLIGSTAARLALGYSLHDAVSFGVAAASLVVGGRGGTGFVPTTQQTLAHAERRIIG